MTVDIGMEPVDPSRCPQCGTVVACGAVASGSDGAADAVQCWCLDWPRLPASARLGVGACLCPACLRAALVAAGVPVDGTAADPDTAI
ncbi:hypothetical protein LXM60_13015 [Pandoraea sputorum]|uniref:cysteine-rich CWC family protein n=1 Tax=Pandoraea sputorum TaxID=93222 RepID=UPI001E626432|nr:cysteine-rich CWC family protein [Pandoraea sputorum]MCE4061126.1 hypothetical protein [Pandoraea sputorum]